MTTPTARAAQKRKKNQIVCNTITPVAILFAAFSAACTFYFVFSNFRSWLLLAYSVCLKLRSLHALFVRLSYSFRAHQAPRSMRVSCLFLRSLGVVFRWRLIRAHSTCVFRAPSDISRAHVVRTCPAFRGSQGERARTEKERKPR